MNLSNLKPNNIEVVSYQNNVQAKVLCLAWHPDNENLLAFSTEDGRVAVYDISKPSNVPKLMKPFTGKPVYQLSWAKIGIAANSTSVVTTDDTTTKPLTRTVLFACSRGNLVYFPESGESKNSN